MSKGLILWHFWDTAKPGTRFQDSGISTGWNLSIFKSLNQIYTAPVSPSSLRGQEAHHLVFSTAF